MLKHVLCAQALLFIGQTYGQAWNAWENYGDTVYVTVTNTHYTCPCDGSSTSGTVTINPGTTTTTTSATNTVGPISSTTTVISGTTTVVPVTTTTTGGNTVGPISQTTTVISGTTTVVPVTTTTTTTTTGGNTVGPISQTTTVISGTTTVVPVTTTTTTTDASTTTVISGTTTVVPVTTTTTTTTAASTTTVISGTTTVVPVTTTTTTTGASTTTVISGTTTVVPVTTTTTDASTTTVISGTTTVVPVTTTTSASSTTTTATTSGPAFFVQPAGSTLVPSSAGLNLAVDPTFDDGLLAFNATNTRKRDFSGALDRRQNTAGSSSKFSVTTANELVDLVTGYVFAIQQGSTNTRATMVSRTCATSNAYTICACFVAAGNLNCDCGNGAQFFYVDFLGALFISIMRDASPGQYDRVSLTIAPTTA